MVRGATRGHGKSACGTETYTHIRGRARTRARPHPIRRRRVPIHLACVENSLACSPYNPPPAAGPGGVHNNNLPVMEWGGGRVRSVPPRSSAKERC